LAIIFYDYNVVYYSVAVSAICDAVVHPCIIH